MSHLDEGKSSFRGREVGHKAVMLLEYGRSGSRLSEAIFSLFPTFFFEILDSKVIYTSRGFQRYIIRAIWTKGSRVSGVKSERLCWAAGQNFGITGAGAPVWALERRGYWNFDISTRLAGA